jgi:hypothetical protein
LRHTIAVPFYLELYCEIKTFKLDCTNKTDHQDIAAILLKEALNTIALTPFCKNINLV